MNTDLSLAQNHAFQLSRTLMVPVTLFRSGDEFGVLPSDDLDCRLAVKRVLPQFLWLTEY
ncbi:hypothetical protein [Oryzifoliimicrobium ureilyticus]|uniref:hypothetical protein n=1 Tax=Oryzifoliimicrobium ureilyticus TaxID=3113724 RepID=UPI003075F59B